MPAVDSYVVTHLSAHPTVDAAITCMGAGANVGILQFHKEGTPLPANSAGPTGTVPVVHFPASRFNDVINTLRYEKPLQFNISAGLIGMVGTGREPVGEQEGV